VWKDLLKGACEDEHVGGRGIEGCARRKRCLDDLQTLMAPGRGRD
jgi:hypothetical protein